MGAEGNYEDNDYEKLQALPESDSMKPSSGHTDAARFGEVALEAAKNYLQNNKVID